MRCILFVCDVVRVVAQHTFGNVELPSICYQFETGHIVGMLGPDAISCWGIPPGKTSVQPEVLGLGFAKLVVTGFTSLVIIHVPKMLDVVAKVPSCIWELGFKEPPFRVGSFAEHRQVVDGCTSQHVCRAHGR